MSAEPQIQHAIRAVRIAIDPNARDQYVGQIRAFAQAFSFTTTFSQTSPDPNDVVAHMERDGIQIIGGMASRFGGPLVYKFFFYANRDRQISPSSLDPLVEGLRRFLGGIEGATVTETQLEN